MCSSPCFQANCKFEHLFIWKVLKWCYLFSSSQKVKKKKYSRLYLLKYLLMHLIFFLRPPYNIIPAENSCEIYNKLLCQGISSTTPVHLSFQQHFLWSESSHRSWHVPLPRQFLAVALAVWSSKQPWENFNLNLQLIPANIYIHISSLI